jgi:hypothetical protein
VGAVVLLVLVPRPCATFVYRLIAKYRYRVFGTQQRLHHADARTESALCGRTLGMNVGVATASREIGNRESPLG